MAREVLVFGPHKVRLFQRNDQPSNYWFMRVQLEGKPFKRSLKTAHLESARDAATQVMIEALSKIKAGQKVFSVTVSDARRAYLLNEQERVAREDRSTYTVKNVVQRIDRAIAFLRDQGITPSASIDSIQGNFWQQYIEWRLKPTPDLRRDGINSELTTIRAWFEWCQKQGWCAASHIPQWELTVEKTQASLVKVPAANFIRARQLMYDWMVAASDTGNPIECENRETIFTVFMTISCGAFRTGEILQVRRKDIQMAGDEIIVTVQDNTSKVRKARQVPLLHEGVICLRSYLNSRPKMKPDERVFVMRGAKEPRNLFYKAFSKLRKNVLIPAGLGDIEPYHARHFAITNWLLMGNSIHLVGRLAGTSVKQIEATYSNVIELSIGREFAQKYLVYKEDGSHEIVKRK